VSAVVSSTSSASVESFLPKFRPKRDSSKDSPHTYRANNARPRSAAVIAPFPFPIHSTARPPLFAAHPPPPTTNYNIIRAYNVYTWFSRRLTVNSPGHIVPLLLLLLLYLLLLLILILLLPLLLYYHHFYYHLPVPGQAYASTMHHEESPQQPSVTSSTTKLYIKTCHTRDKISFLGGHV